MHLLRGIGDILAYNTQLGYVFARLIKNMLRNWRTRNLMMYSKLILTLIIRGPENFHKISIILPNTASWIFTGGHTKYIKTKSLMENKKTSACTNAVNLKVQDATVENDEIGSTSSNIPINRRDSGSMEAKAKRSCKGLRSIEKIHSSWPLFIEKTLIRANLKAVRKFEKNLPIPYKCSLEKDFVSLLGNFIKRAGPLADTPSDKRRGGQESNCWWNLSSGRCTVNWIKRPH